MPSLETLAAPSLRDITSVCTACIALLCRLEYSPGTRFTSLGMPVHDFCTQLVTEMREPAPETRACCAASLLMA